MALVYFQTLPPGTPREFVEEVTQEMDVRGDFPAGLVAHAVFEQDGRVRMVDIWDSRESFDAFESERVGPAVGRVAERHGVDLAAGPPPEEEFYDAYDVIVAR